MSAIHSKQFTKENIKEFFKYNFTDCNITQINFSYKYNGILKSLMKLTRERLLRDELVFELRHLPKYSNNQKKIAKIESKIDKQMEKVSKLIKIIRKNGNQDFNEKTDLQKYLKMNIIKAYISFKTESQTRKILQNTNKKVNKSLKTILYLII